MFDSFREDGPLPVHGSWSYRRIPDGGLVVTAPDSCPRGHQLGPRRMTLNWNPGRQRMMVCCTTCYTTDPRSAMFLPAEPAWMDRFRELVKARRQLEAMALIDSAVPVPPRPRQ